MRWVFAGAVVALLATISYAAPPRNRCILVRVGVTDKEQGRALVAMGLDVWEFQPDGFLSA